MSFKFLQTNPQRPTFQFEITNDIMRRGNISWTREYSDEIRRWMSDLYFENRYTNINEHIIYIHSIDRTCELMETPRLVERENHCPMFSVSVKVWATNDKWMIAKLSYPIEHIIYR